jgi:hypothetical protein
MPRDRRDDDRDEYERDDPRPAPKRSNTPLIIGLVVGAGVVLVGALACGGLFLFGWWAMPGGPVAQNPPVAQGPVADAKVIQPAGGKDGDAKRVYTRDEFRAAVKGKTPEQVIAAVGRPSVTNDNPDGTPRTWFYGDRVTDPATGKPDRGVLDFAGGKVSEVRW